MSKKNPTAKQLAAAIDIIYAHMDIVHPTGEGPAVFEAFRDENGKRSHSMETVSPRDDIDPDTPEEHLDDHTQSSTTKKAAKSKLN